MKRFLLVVWLALSIMAAGMPAATQAAEIEIKRFSGESPTPFQQPRSGGSHRLYRVRG